MMYCGGLVRCQPCRFFGGRLEMGLYWFCLAALMMCLNMINLAFYGGADALITVNIWIAATAIIGAVRAGK
jgi:hypothetical protein